MNTGWDGACNNAHAAGASVNFRRRGRDKKARSVPFVEIGGRRKPPSFEVD
jgi:hypothetical protein